MQLPARVVILAGGPSPEATVSRSTAAGMLRAVTELGLVGEVWELAGDWAERLAKLPKDGMFVLLALHGVPGEDGSIQAALDKLGLPYQGSGVAASAVCMDKIRTREVLAAAGLPVAAGLANPTLSQAEQFLAQHGTVVVKPALAGSSVGVHVVKNPNDLAAALSDAAQYGPAADNPVLVEEFVPGAELTVGVLGGLDSHRALPIIEIVPQGAGQSGLAYDFHSKYTAGGSVHLVPAKLPENLALRIQNDAVKAGCALGATGAYRVDVRYNPKQARWAVLEINTLPGLTPTSLLPDAAAAAGITYAALVRWMLEDGCARWSLNARKT